MDAALSWLNRALILAGPVLLAVTVHELAHGYVAFRKGDPTAKLAGRLTLNPIKHLDLVGTLVFFITQMIGWAKPVPVDPRYFKRPKQDMIWVSLAGPGANLALAVIFAGLYHFLGSLSIMPGQTTVISVLKLAYVLAYLTVVINIGLAVFNLIPIPPLDGSHVLEGLLPPEMSSSFERLKPFGFLILLGLIFLGVINKVIYPIIIAIRGLLL
ncbi:MAG: site-2 protease family protein [Deltaproteobacteria bacterium]|nr:site-2 protease family protein [Deltaproteobacteria bacterium]